MVSIAHKKFRANAKFSMVRICTSGRWIGVADLKWLSDVFNDQITSENVHLYLYKSFFKYCFTIRSSCCNKATFCMTQQHTGKLTSDFSRPIDRCDTERRKNREAEIAEQSASTQLPMQGSWDGILHKSKLHIRKYSALEQLLPLWIQNTTHTTLTAHTHTHTHHEAQANHR